MNTPYRTADRPDIIGPTNWQAFGACKRHPDLWSSDNDDPELVEFAKHLCGGCPARSFCLDYALNTGEREGIWGGLTATERRSLLSKSPVRRLHRSRRRTPAAAADALERAAS